MSIDYRVDQRRGLVITMVYGRIDEAQVRAYAAKVAADPSAQRCGHAIIEISADADLQFGTPVVSELSLANPAMLPRRVAVVAPSDVSYGLARVFQGFRGDALGNETQVFRARGEAEAWLALDPPTSPR